MTKETPTAATPTPEERAYAIVQPLTVDSVMRRDELVTRIAAAIRQHSEALRAENERLTAKLDACILVKDRAFTAAATAEAALAASQERERGMREALTVACTWGIASANFSASVSLDLRDWFVAFVAGRREPFPADMLKTLSIIDPDLHAALQPQEAADVR